MKLETYAMVRALYPDAEEVRQVPLDPKIAIPANAMDSVTLSVAFQSERVPLGLVADGVYAGQSKKTGIVFVVEL